MSGLPAPDPKETKSSTEFQRVDLTGSRIRRWTTRARETLASALQRIVDGIKRGGDTQLPGSDETIERTIKRAPAKGVKFIESKLDQTNVENQLKSAQAETEFLKQELLREQVAKTQAETRGQQLSNVERELEIRSRIAEITDGRTDIQLVWDDDESPILIVGNLRLEDDDDSRERQPTDSG